MSLRVNQLVGFNRRGGIVTQGLQLWLDFQNPNCYNAAVSDQNINDLSPNAFALHRGLTTGVEASDPTFTAGPPAYFQYDGGDVISHTDAYSGSIMRTTFRQDNDRTIEVWVRRAGVANTDEILFSCNSSGAANGGSFYIDYTANKARLGGDPTSVTIDLGNQIPIDTWQHVAAVFRPNGSTTCRLYQNATETGTGTFNNSSWTVGDSETVCGIGGNRALTVPFQNGSRLAIFRMYDRLLGADEIARNFAAERGRFGV